MSGEAEATLFAVPARRRPSAESPAAKTHTWLTPPGLLAALGAFDLDPCACPSPRPWPTAATHWTREDGALARPWFGRVWLNPPYGREIHVWLRRLAAHGHGTALIFARTETAIFHETVWQAAAAVCFLRGRLRFHRQNGALAAAPAPAPAVLVAYGAGDADRLASSGLAGQCIRLR